MAWFLNFYQCARCRRRWADQWSYVCDDDCPHCGARHMAPFDAEELTTLIEAAGQEFVVLWSPETAEHDPDYRELGRFPSRRKALEFLSPAVDLSLRPGREFQVARPANSQPHILSSWPAGA
jgi:hypothetical protein